MSNAADLASGKTHRDENFPVASLLIHPRHRAIILAFYRFARAADDVADHETAAPTEKLALLESMRASLAGESQAAPEAAALRAALAERKLSNEHALDLLEAFRRDVTKSRYADWNELMEYCRYSAMPVGRFVLDVHGESCALWSANDALCAALQVINHLQDCAKDYRALARVYLPADALGTVPVTALDAPKSSPALLSVIHALARRTMELLREAKRFGNDINDARLALEVRVIQRLAEDLAEKLAHRDPLSDGVHHGKLETLWLAGSCLPGFALSRLRSRKSPSKLVRS
ncbi:MAG TPA: squalene synthase HpnC [Rhizomicrobium sp.]|jgi:squalene synthase HpnC|nr:squalene synthase HpnC [Rhizomicrobium sp.]